MNTDRGIDYMMSELIHAVRFNICEHLKYTSVPPTKVYLGMKERMVFEDYYGCLNFDYENTSQTNKLNGLTVIPVAMSSYLDVS